MIIYVYTLFSTSATCIQYFPSKLGIDGHCKRPLCLKEPWLQIGSFITQALIDIKIDRNLTMFVLFDRFRCLQTYWCHLWKLTAKRTRWLHQVSRKLNTSTFSGFREFHWQQEIASEEHERISLGGRLEKHNPPGNSTVGQCLCTHHPRG